MSIVARYPARCASCSGSITPGQKIEWTKGQPVRHTACGSAVAATIAPIPGKCAKCGAECGQYRTCYRHSEAAKKCGTCGGTAGTRGAYGQYTGGTCQCCRPNCNCYDCRS